MGDSRPFKISGSFLPNLGDSTFDIGDIFRYPSNTRNLKEVKVPGTMMGRFILQLLQPIKFGRMILQRRLVKFYIKVMVN